MQPKRKVETITGVCEAKTPQWENAISPSKFPSSARYEESQAVTCRDKDNVLWGCITSELTDAQINGYLQLTRHLKQDTALAILRDSGHDIASAVDMCNYLEEIRDLSLLEVRVLRDAAPCPYTVINGELSDTMVHPEKHIFGLLPHVPPSVIVNQYYRIGREPLHGYSTGWQRSLDRLKSLVSEELDSPLYKKQGGRTLRSSAFVVEAPMKRGRRDKLAIAMVGFDQKKALKDDDAPIRLHAFPLPSFNRTVAPPIDRRAYRTSNENRLPLVPIRRVRCLNNAPLVPSPLVAPPSSSSIAPPVNPSSISRKPRRDPLDIDMNWRAIDNGARTRRQATVKKENESEEEQMEKKESSSVMATLPFGIGRDSRVFGASATQRANTNLENFTNLDSRIADLKRFSDMCTDMENRLRGEVQIEEVFDEDEQ